MYNIIQASLSQEIKIEKIIKKDNHISVRLSLGLSSEIVPSSNDLDVRIMLYASEPGEVLNLGTIRRSIQYPDRTPGVTVQRFKLKPNSTFIYATETKKYYSLGEIKLDLNDEIFNNFKGIYLYAYENRDPDRPWVTYAVKRPSNLTISEFIIKKEVGERPITFNDSPRTLNSSIINGQSSIFDSFKKLESSVKTLKLPAFSDLQITTSNENLNIGFFVNIKNIILNQFSFLNNTQNKGVADMVTYGAEKFITEVNLIERKSGSTNTYRLSRTDLPSMEITPNQRSGLLYYTFSRKIDSFSRGIESKFEVEISLKNSLNRILLEGIKPSILFLDRFVYIIEDMSNNDVFYDFANDRYINLSTIVSTLNRDLKIPPSESFSAPENISIRLSSELVKMLAVLEGFGVSVDHDLVSVLRKSVFFSEDHYPTKESVSLFIQAYQSIKKLYKKIFNENNILFNFPNLSQGFGSKKLGTNFKYPIYKIHHSFNEIFRPEEHDVKLSYFQSTAHKHNFSSIDLTQYRTELDNKIRTYFNINRASRLTVNSDLSSGSRPINIGIYNFLSPSNIKVKNEVLVDLDEPTEWREQYYNVTIIRLLDYVLFKNLELPFDSESTEDLEEKFKLNTYRLLANLNTGLGRPKVLGDISTASIVLGADDLVTGDEPPPVLTITTTEEEPAPKTKTETDDGSSSDSLRLSTGSKKSDESSDDTYSRADSLIDTGKDTFAREEVVDTPAEENIIIPNADFLLNLIHAAVQEGGEIFSSFKYNEALRNKEEFLRSIRSLSGSGVLTLPFPLYSLYENLQSEVQSVSSRTNFSFTEIENAIYLSMIRLRFSNIVKIERMTGFETMSDNPDLLNLKKITYTEINEDFINNEGQGDSGDFICRMVKYSPGDTNSLWYVNNNNLLNFNIENNIFRIIK